MTAEPDELRSLLRAAVPEVPVAVELADVHRRALRQRHRVQVIWSVVGTVVAVVLLVGGLAVTQVDRSSAPVTSASPSPAPEQVGAMLSLKPGLDPAAAGLGAGNGQWATLLQGHRLAVELDDANCPPNPQGRLVVVGDQQVAVRITFPGLASGSESGDIACLGTGVPYTAIFRLPDDTRTDAAIDVVNDWGGQGLRTMTVPAQ